MFRERKNVSSLIETAMVLSFFPKITFEYASKIFSREQTFEIHAVFCLPYFTKKKNMDHLLPTAFQLPIGKMSQSNQSSANGMSKNGMPKTKI